MATWSSSGSGGFSSGYGGSGGYTSGSGNFSGGGDTGSTAGRDGSGSRITTSITTRNPPALGVIPVPSPPPVTTLKVETVTSTQRFDNGIIDASIIPYIRGLEVEFVATGLRPNRRVWFFFDNLDVTRYIAPSNYIELTANGAVTINGNSYSSGVNPNTIFKHGKSGKIRLKDNASKTITKVHSYRWKKNDDDSKGNTIIHYSSKSIFGNLNPGQGWTADYSAANSDGEGVIRTHVIRSGIIQGAANDSIYLGEYAKHLPNNFWGTDGSNTAHVTSGHYTYGGVGKFKKIKAWDNVSRKLTFDTDWDEVPFILPPIGKIGPHDKFPQIRLPNSVVTISTTNLFDSSGVGFYTDNEGSISGTFYIPDGLFRTGDRVFKIIDTWQGDIADATTYATYTFSAQGLKTTTQDIVETVQRIEVTTISPPPPPPPPPPAPPPVRPPPLPPVYPPAPPPSPPPFIRDPRAADGGHGDPLAQTFFVDSSTNPDGIFLSSVDLWFRNKDKSAPVMIEIRPTVNGYPSSKERVPGSYVTLYPQEVLVTDNPNFIPKVSRTPGEMFPIDLRSTGATNFKFSDPIYLPPGEYALVVMCDTWEYEVWAAELGEKIVGTDRIVGEQPYIGSLFKSQNSSTWTPTQLEDLMFALNQCEFTPAGSVTFINDKPSANLNTDALMLHMESTPVVPSTNIKFEIKETGSAYNEILRETMLFSDSGRSITSGAADGYWSVRSTLKTSNPDVSPIIFRNRNTLVSYENFVDDASIEASDIIITNRGTGFSQNANVEIVITSNTGSGAKVYGIANTAGSGLNSNGIDYIIVTDGGSGYIDSTTAAAVKVGNSAGGTAQTFSIISETNSSGGSALVKYISRVATLNEGFESADIKVFLTAYKPVGTNIQVYYKIKNSNDPDNFNDKNFILMKQASLNSAYSSGKDDFIEFEFEPVGAPNPITYTSGTTSYKTFNQYQIKIILTASDTTNPPVLKNMRAIALPGQEF